MIERLRREHPETRDEDDDDVAYSWFSDRDHEQFEPNAEEQQLSDERNRLAADSDVAFLLEADRIVASLKDKSAAVQAYKENPESLTAFLKQQMKDKTSVSKGVKGIIYGAFDVFVMLDVDWFEKHISPSADGFHFVNSPVSVFRDRVEEPDYDPVQTRNHEQIHNFLDQSKFHGTRHFGFFDKIDRWSDVVRRYLRLSSLPVPDEILDFEKRMVERLDAEGIIDSNIDEWLAGMEKAENQEFRMNSMSQSMLDELKPIVHASKAAERFPSIIDSLLSSQIVAINLLSYFEEKIAGIKPDEFVKRQIDGLREEVPKLFYTVVKEMQTALGIGRRLGGEADEFAHFAFVLFKPSQYAFVEALLRHRYGETRVEKAKQVYELVDSFEPSLEYIRRTAEALKLNPKLLEKDDLRTLSENILIGENFFRPAVFSIDTVNEMRAYLAAIHELSNIFRANGIDGDTGEIDYYITLKHFLEALDFIVENDSGMPDGWETLNHFERSFLIQVLKDYVWRGQLHEDLAKRLNKKKLTKKDVLSSSFWRVVRSVKAEGEILPMVDEYFPEGRKGKRS